MDFDYIHLRPRAKINLTLEITGRRADGYHEISTVMQTLRLRDDLFISKTPRKEIYLATENLTLPPEENLVHKAARLLEPLYREKFSGGISMRLVKRIPSEAGLGGGSSDAAAALRGLNRLFELGLAPAELERLGAGLGADVPFFIRGGTRLARGIGEILTPLPPCPPLWVVLAKPPFAVLTAWAYGKLDETGDFGAPAEFDFTGDTLNLREIARKAQNFLQAPVAARHPEIVEIAAFLRRRGALLAMMSGSGSCVFGLFENPNKARAAKDALPRRFGGVWAAVTKTFSCG
ncbi:MAG: 4-(cytidine 5'-diphospho)-2-C-methyl-D-erythritol kinase [Clostridiales bacterium]|jgi:4-diphosphocytidyl-2-C-methyl-D-erythritol kinase|nr:4-(cytidine 5'-diphospho)-2-C-methyl-D-erythritol kinase [Clostridiales bacterium]